MRKQLRGLIVVSHVFLKLSVPGQLAWIVIKQSWPEEGVKSCLRQKARKKNV